VWLSLTGEDAVEGRGLYGSYNATIWTVSEGVDAVDGGGGGGGRDRRRVRDVFGLCRYGFEMWLKAAVLVWCDYSLGRKPEDGLSRAVATCSSQLGMSTEKGARGEHPVIVFVLFFFFPLPIFP
jgi:hypothetical protein